MAERGYEFEELVKSAYRYTIQEVGLDKVKPSLRLEFERLQKAHNAIHEFMLLAPLLFPCEPCKQISWQSKSAFFILHWEAFHHAHRSLIEALCAYYNVSFVLLRTTLELVVKGAFWECMSHKEYRQNCDVLDNDAWGKRIKGWLNEIFELSEEVKEEFEETSAGIYDKIGPIIEVSDFRPNIKTIVSQLAQWDIFNPIPDPITAIYRGIYGRLSADAHVVPNRTDIGKRILNMPSQIFDQEILQDTLSEYTHCLHEVMDLAIVVELNVVRDLIGRYDEVKGNLWERTETLNQLGLKYSLIRAKELLK